MMPVPEPKSVMIGTTSKIKDNSENLSARAVHVRSLRRKYNSTNNEARYSDDLDGRENKFTFTVDTGAEHIDNNGDDEAYCDPHGVVDCSEIHCEFGPKEKF